MFAFRAREIEFVCSGKDAGWLLPDRAANLMISDPHSSWSDLILEYELVKFLNRNSHYATNQPLKMLS